MEIYSGLHQETWRERLSRNLAYALPQIGRKIALFLIGLIQSTIRFILSLISEAFGRS